ncbi:NUDIX domain-containing protein [Motiliproteus sp. SC1-56]|uniref:NUDIX domain-containing protein n=1 Tax=Motiliproteus sp. SC1-56 TaxID=2799565 RepID=UPI001A8EDB10|nr:NUDIX domain-containing protein [Motiliproteus sp. SC1-56]
MESLAVTFGHGDVEIEERETAYQGFFKLQRLRLRHRLFAGGWSAWQSRELFVRDDAVCVLLYDPDEDAVVLIEQFRVGALKDNESPWLLELVAGIVEPGESTAEVAARESREEAGAELLNWQPALRYHVSPGGSQEQVELVCAQVDATRLGGYHGAEEEGEDIRVCVVSRQEAYRAVCDGRIRNAHTLVALQWLQLNVTELRARWKNTSG